MMNLQEQISRIKSMMSGINESKYLIRRVNIDELDNLCFDNENYVLSKFRMYKIKNVSEFKKRVIDYIIDDLHPMLSDSGQIEFNYDEIFDFLMNRYSEHMSTKYSNYITR